MTMKQVKQFAQKQEDIYNELGISDNLIGFNFNGTFIFNPFVSEDCMQEVNPIKYYGKENYNNYVKQIYEANTINIYDNVRFSVITETETTKRIFDHLTFNMEVCNNDKIKETIKKMKSKSN